MRLWLSRTLALIRKEFLALMKDRSSRALLFAPVLMQSLLFGYGATHDLTHAPYAVLDQSRGQIAERIDSGEALLVLSFPGDFEARLSRGEEAPVQLLLDGQNSVTAGAAGNQIAAIIARANAKLGLTAPVSLMRRAWFNPNLESRWNMMPAMIASLGMLQTLLLAALSVAREREQGTFDQLLVTPLTPMQTLVGKALPAIVIGIAQSSLILLVLRFWFRVPTAGSFGTLYLGLFGFTTASVGIGLSISAVSRTMQQAMLWTFMLIMPLMLLSGLLTPVRNMPAILQIATHAKPQRSGIDTVRRVYLEGTGLADVGMNFLPLAGWLFRHRL